MRERGRGASVRTSRDFMLRTSSGSSISNQLVRTGIGGAPSSSGGSPIVRSTASEERAKVARDLIRAVADKTVSDFFGVFVGPEKIQKRCIVVLTRRALGNLKTYHIGDDPHIVTCDPYTKKDKKFVTMKNNATGRIVKGVNVTDLELIKDNRKGYHKKEVLRDLGIFPNKGIKRFSENIQQKNPEKWGMVSSLHAHSCYRIPSSSD